MPTPGWELLRCPLIAARNIDASAAGKQSTHTDETFVSRCKRVVRFCPLHLDS